MKHRIVVLGAGYTGAIAAGRLARRLHPSDTEVTVVSAADEFIERVRLHQLAAGQELKRHDLADMFAGTAARVRLARVDAVDPERRVVVLDGGVLEYDTLVYALGSTTTDHGVPGVAEHAYDIAGKAAALRLRERLTGLGAGGTVLVVGGGLTGIEAVTEFAESRPDLALAVAVRGGLGGWLSPRGRRHLRRVCDRLDVTVHEHTDVTAAGPDGVVTDRGPIRADVTVWTGGFAVHPLAAASGLAVDESGRIAVDASMRSVSHPNVFAIGDAALAAGPGGTPLRMSCASGIPTAWAAAGAIVADLTGAAAGKVPLRYFNQCVSLGRSDGLIQYVTADDRARSAVLTGRLAARYKELVCKGAVFGVAHPRLMPVRRRRVGAGERAAART